MLLRKWEIRRCFVFPPHLSSASALPYKIGNPQDSALVQCACNTVQLLQRSQLRLSWTMPPNSPERNTLITRFRESYSSMSMSCEFKILKTSSSWLNSVNALIQHLSEKCYLRKLRFPRLPGSADAQVIWGGILKHLLIAYFIGKISAKSVHMCQSYNKPWCWTISEKCLLLWVVTSFLSEVVIIWTFSQTRWFNFIRITRQIFTT